MPTNKLEEQYRTKLRKILVDHFGEEDLRTLCTDLGVEYDSLPGQGKTGKARELIDHLDRRGELSGLIELGKEQRPRAHWDDIDIQETLPFQNREDEIRNIMSSLAPPFFLLDAPAGYGKSVLLKNLTNRFNEGKWLAVYVRLEEGESLRQTVQKLCRALGVKCSLQGRNAYRWGATLAGALKQHKLEQITRSGLVFLIDFDNRAAPRVLDDLLGQFIPAVQRSLRGLTFFASRHNCFRVVLAGRHLAGQVDSTLDHVPLNVLRLTPFDYDVVRETGQAALPQHQASVVIQIAAHLMYFTGGHPGCIARCLKKYEETGLTPDEFLEFCADEVWEEIIKPVVQAIRESVPQDLCHVLDRLSVFRYLDYPLLNALTEGEEPLIKEYGSGSDLADKLTGTYLLSWQHRLLRDDITRRLLTIRLREEQKADLPAWCSQAQEMCAEHLQRQQTQLPEFWTIEYLYQVLQEHSGVTHDRKRRAALRERFFASDVPQALKWLLKDRQGKAEQQALNEALGSDWEFGFTVNYFLREETYTDLPYQRLLKEVNAFLE